MNIKTYGELARRTVAKLDTKEKDNIHMLFGIITECGEMIDIYKRELAYNKPIDITNVKEEIGDIMFYVINFCNINNLDIDEILEKNIAKLESRYPNLRFDEDNAIARNLEKERLILENDHFRSPALNQD